MDDTLDDVYECLDRHMDACYGRISLTTKKCMWQTNLPSIVWPLPLLFDYFHRTMSGWMLVYTMKLEQLRYTS